MRRLLAHRDARIYLVGQVVSLFGDSCLTLAMSIWIKTLTGSNASAGFVFFFFAAAGLLAPVAGLMVDRLRRRPVLMATNTLTACAVLVLLFVHNAGQAWLVDAVMFAYGLSNTVINPAQSALLTVMLPADLLADANGALRGIRESLRLVGPLTGAGLFVAVGAHAIVLLDAVTFAVPILTLLALRVVEPRPQPPVQPWHAQTIAGYRYITRIPALRHVVIAGACATAVIGFGESTIFAVAANGLHRPAAFVGVLDSMQGIGAVLSGLTAGPLIRRIGEGPAMGLGLLLVATGTALQTPASLAPVVAGVIVFGVGFPWVVIGLYTLVQRLAPPELQGRAYSATALLVITPQTLSIAVGAALIGLTGYRALLITTAIVVSLAACYLLSRPEHRVRMRPGPAV